VALRRVRQGRRPQDPRCEARYSSSSAQETTTGSGSSIAAQLAACHKAAGSDDVVDFVDEAKTGRAMAGRTELLRRLAEAEAGRIAKVLVYKYDRLGRSLAETSTIIADLEDRGVEVVSVTEGRDQLVVGDVVDVRLKLFLGRSNVLCQIIRAGGGREMKTN
jgi:DNA invertase Pin-like site-specific DNA recombinase